MFFGFCSCSDLSVLSSIHGHLSIHWSVSVAVSFFHVTHIVARFRFCFADFNLQEEASIPEDIFDQHDGDIEDEDAGVSPQLQFPSAPLGPGHNQDDDQDPDPDTDTDPDPEKELPAERDQEQDDSDDDASEAADIVSTLLHFYLPFYLLEEHDVFSSAGAEAQVPSYIDSLWSGRAYIQVRAE